MPSTHVEVRGQCVGVASLLPPCGSEFCSNGGCLMLSPWSPELRNFLCYRQLPNSILVLWVLCSSSQTLRSTWTNGLQEVFA